MQPVIVGNYLVTNVAVNGHLVQIRQDVNSIGSPSTGDNTKIIDLTDQWPSELTGVTGG